MYILTQQTKLLLRMYVKFGVGSSKLSAKHKVVIKDFQSLIRRYLCLNDNQLNDLRWIK